MNVHKITPQMVFDFYGRLEQDIDPENACALEGFALEDGEVFAMGGIQPIRPNVGHAWALLDRPWRRHARIITKLCAHHIRQSRFPRIEAAVRYGFAGGERWLERMGFSKETEFAYKWDGVFDYTLWARWQLHS